MSTGCRSLQEFKKISIVEVKGYCYGWHFYQAADADIVIASEDSLFGHAAWRYAGFAARQWQWCTTMGVRKFMEMVFTGRPFTAKEMYDTLVKYLEGRHDLGFWKGLVDFVLEPQNPFEPEKRREPKKEFVLAAVLVGLPLGAFVYFNFWV